MKESRFIEQNREKWQEAEALLKSEKKDPEKLSSLFVQIVDDLSYARTFYPNRSVRVYLNKIARQYFSIIYGRKKKEKHNKFLLFWLDELPQVILHCKRELLISFLVFILAIAIGVFSSYNDPEFVNTILGDEYVAMSQANIDTGDPMAVYKKSNEVEMFLGITFNNLMVAFRTYVLGIFIGIGTLGSLLSNGIMVGTFQFFFAGRGLLFESAVTIWLHGTLEISSIILAGGAGLTLGSGLIFPGTYSRLQSLQLSGIRSLKLMLGIVPVFILAAIIESFLTRHTEAPVLFKIFLILLSASYIIGYFAVYPWWKSRKGFRVPIKEVKLPVDSRDRVNFTQIKSNAELLKDAFQFYSRNSNRILIWSFVVAALVSAASLFYQEENLLFTVDEWWLELLSSMFFALSTPNLAAIFINALALATILYRVMKLIDAESKNERFKFDANAALHLFVIALILTGSIYLGVWGVLFSIVVFGMLFFIGFVQLTKRNSLMESIEYGFTQFRKNNNQGLSLQFSVLLLSFSFLLVLTAPLLYIHTNILEWNFIGTEASSRYFIQFIEAFLKVFSFYLVLPVILAALSYLYFSQEEVTNARSLMESITKMGIRQPTGKNR